VARLVQAAGSRLPRGDDRPAGPADVTGVQHDGGNAARQGLAVQQCLDLRLAGAVRAVGGAGLVLGDRHPQRRTVHPDCPAMHQQRAGRAQRLDELPRRGRGEADQVDHHVRAERRDPGPEGSRRILRLPVDCHPGDRAPVRARVIRIADAATKGGHIVAAAHQSRYQVTADVPGSSDDNDAAHLQGPFRREWQVT
jgi:hypothetical protein